MKTTQRYSTKRHVLHPFHTISKKNKQQSIRCEKIQELSIKQDHQSKTKHYKKQAHYRLKAKQQIKNPESER